MIQLCSIFRFESRRSTETIQLYGDGVVTWEIRAAQIVRPHFGTDLVTTDNIRNKYTKSNWILRDSKRRPDNLSSPDFPGHHTGTARSQLSTYPYLPTAR